MKQGIYRIELESDYIYLINTLHNEYFYAAKERLAKDQKRRSLFSWRPKERDSQCRWEVEEC